VALRLLAVRCERMVGVLRMYGRDEHRYALRRIGDATRELEGVREQLDSLTRDLVEDDTDGRAVRSLDYLATARLRVSSALGQCDLAVQHLPTPVAR
jgi:cell division FtsZ-interacting protein ZapD